MASPSARRASVGLGWRWAGYEKKLLRASEQDEAERAARQERARQLPTQDGHCG